MTTSDSGSVVLTPINERRVQISREGGLHAVILSSDEFQELMNRGLDAPTVAHDIVNGTVTITSQVYTPDPSGQPFTLTSAEFEQLVRNGRKALAQAKAANGYGQSIGSVAAAST